MGCPALFATSNLVVFMALGNSVIPLLGVVERPPLNLADLAAGEVEGDRPGPLGRREHPEPFGDPAERLFRSCRHSPALRARSATPVPWSHRSSLIASTIPTSPRSEERRVGKQQ